MDTATCTLCGTPVEVPLVEGSAAFCCHGCKAVHAILEKRGELEGFWESALFQQALSSGLISNPTLLDRLAERQRRKEGNTGSRERVRSYLEIDGLWCPSCAHVIEWILLQTRGILGCRVDYATDVALVEYDPMHLGLEEIIASIGSLGYCGRPFENQTRFRAPRALYIRLFVALFCAMNLMMFSYPVYASYFNSDTEGLERLFALLSFGVAIPLISYCAWPLWRRCWNGWSLGFFGMETLVLIATGAAFTFSTYQIFKGSNELYFDSMAVILSFVLLGKVIETRAKFSSKQTLHTLQRTLPRKGRKCFEDGKEAFVPIKEIAVGETFRVLTGERIPLDGIVLEGEGGVDESMMSGESVPVKKQAESEVLGGTLLLRGSLRVKVTVDEEKMRLQQILNVLEGDLKRHSEADSLRLTDHIARRFVPIVLTCAVLAGGWVAWTGGGAEEILLRAMAVLLISCPCAIGIASPLVESLLMHGLARE
ncbi:MAG: HAD-IC family P-type ATPase, partial [Chlamydiia bacterium]|nr:HAD-IC family P-type ATPase [Chlamydiia bacterium]